MNAPPSFDYLRSVPSLEEALSSCRVPTMFKAASQALCCSALFALAAWFFEGARMHRAVEFEGLNAGRYAQQLSALSAERVVERRAQMLTDLDLRVRRIAESGTLEARRLAALSADLPANVWITAITPDTDGLLIDGRTGNMKGLSDALIRLNADPLFAKPSLVGAQITTAGVEPLRLRFSLHVTAPIR